MSNHVCILLLALRWAHPHKRERLGRWHCLLLNRGLLNSKAVLLIILVHLILTRKEGARLLTLGLLQKALTEHGILLDCLWSLREKHWWHRFSILGALVSELLIVVDLKLG